MNILMTSAKYDYDICKNTIDRLRNIYGSDITEIFIISQDDTFEYDNVQVIPESTFEFTKYVLSTGDKYSHRAGWGLQMLLKIFGTSLIDNGDDDCLIWEAEAYICNKIQQRDESNTPILYSSRSPIHTPYVTHANKLFKTNFIPSSELDTVVDMQLWSIETIKEMILYVEELHSKSFVDSWLACALPKIHDSSFAEYICYPLYCKMTNRNYINRTIRKRNEGNLKFNNFDRYDMVVFHKWARDEVNL